MVEKIIIYGVGEEISKINTELLEKTEYLVDIDINKHNTMYNKKKIYEPNKLLEEDLKQIMVLVSSVKFYSEIAMLLTEMGFTENQNFMLAAKWSGNELSPPAYVKSDWGDLEKTYKMDEMTGWQIRIKLMYRLFSCSSQSVMDLGAGAMTLKRYLPDDIRYIPVDYIKRYDETVVCDFNKQEFPNYSVDTIFVSGCLEYVENVEWFIEKIQNQCAKEVIISYRSLELTPDIQYRVSIGWVNFYTTTEIIEIFQKYGFLLSRSLIMRGKTVILKFTNRR
jgi:hypothetical protein